MLRGGLFAASFATLSTGTWRDSSDDSGLAPSAYEGSDINRQALEGYSCVSAVAQRSQTASRYRGLS
jgi:hypothetical protein